jgi:hypothetical protein
VINCRVLIDGAKDHEDVAELPWLETIERRDVFEARQAMAANYGHPIPSPRAVWSWPPWV